MLFFVTGAHMRATQRRLELWGQSGFGNVATMKFIMVKNFQSWPFMGLGNIE
jgi:hypothetical protein